MAEFLVELHDPRDQSDSREIVTADQVIMVNEMVMFVRAKAQTWKGRFETVGAPEFEIIEMIAQALVVRVSMLEPGQLRITDADLEELRKQR